MSLILIVLDSVGIGEAPDAGKYGDAGCATLPHIAEAVGGINLPTFEKLGLGNIPELLPGDIGIKGVKPVVGPQAHYGAMQEKSEGKDTITGHWEIAGLELNPGFQLFPPGPPSFPANVIDEFEKRTGRKAIANKAASGTSIIEELGEQQMKEGSIILYTSADSVMQLAAHMDVVPLKELYEACKIAREICDPLKVGRVIARPFKGEPGNFVRTEDRRDFAFRPDEPFIFERVQQAGITTCAVGKIDDIFAHRGIDKTNHTGNTLASQEATRKFYLSEKNAFIFANFIDFDMIYGHRRDPQGYSDALLQTDEFFASLLPEIKDGDLLIITADHGNDPTFKGTDHTREYVPLLVYQPGMQGKNLGIRNGFYDVAQSIASYFNLDPVPRGKSFL